MKTKALLLAALVGAAAVSANAGVRFGVSVGLPLPVVTAPVLVAPAPVYVAPAPVVVAEPVTPCPGVGYVWAPGYWYAGPAGRVWVRGGWNYHPDFAGRAYYGGHYAGHYYAGHRW